MPTDEQIAVLHIKIRDLFDTANRVMFADYFRDHAHDPDIAFKSTEQVREVWFREAEKTWDSFREECEFRTIEELDETLAVFKQKESALTETKTLVDHLREGGLHLDPALDLAGARIDSVAADPFALRNPDPVDHQVRPLTQQLIDAVFFDLWPGRAAIVDFGIDSESHLGALQYAIRNELVTPQELDAAMGNGAKLTEIAQRGDNPYGDVTFRTSWDKMFVEPQDGPAWHDPKALFAEIRADEHAARVRDYGEADAATYEQRVRDGGGSVQHLEPLPEPVTAAELEQAVSEIERSWLPNQAATRDEKSEFSAILNGTAKPEVKQERGSKEKEIDLER